MSGQPHNRIDRSRPQFDLTRLGHGAESLISKWSRGHLITTNAYSAFSLIKCTLFGGRALQTASRRRSHSISWSHHQESVSMTMDL